MSYNIKGDMEVLRYGTSKGKNLATSVGGFESNNNGLIELDSYSQDGMEELFSVLPVSKYGTGDYLPAGVAGSFEGASINPAYKGRTLLLEDNGDLVMLRNGTNGSSRSIYYSYLPNALNTSNMNGFINTNKKYNPGYFNNQYNAIYSINSDRDTVFLGGEKNSDLSSVFMVSLTTGTLDDTVHRGIIFPISTFIGTPTFCMKGNTHIYVFTATSFGSTSPIAMHVYTIPVVDVQNQVASPVWTKVVGWNTTSFYNDVFSNSDTIMVTNLTASTNVADKPFLLYPSDAVGMFLNSGNGLDFYAAQDKVSGLIRFKITFDTYTALSTDNIRPKTQFNILVNPSNKNCNVENLQAATPLVVTSNGSTLSYSGWTVIDNDIYNSMVNTWYSYSISPSSGLSFIHRSGTTANESNSIYRAPFNSIPPSIYESLRISYIYSNETHSDGTVYSTFASPVGGALKNIELLPNNNIRLTSNDNFSSPRNVRSSYTPPANYTYNNYDGSTMLGYAPSNDRSYINAGYKNFISTLNTAQVVTTNGGILTEYNLSTPEIFDQDANPVGASTISTTAAVLTNLKNAMLAGVPSLSSTSTPRVALFVPRQSNIPVFAIVQAEKIDNSGYIKVVEVSTNTRTGNITTATISRFVSEHSLGWNINDIQNTFNLYLTGVTIYEGSDFYGLMITFPYFTSVVGNSNGWMATSKVLKSNGQLTPLTNLLGLNPYPTGSSYWCALPNQGFGSIRGDIDAAYSYTRLIFSSFGTTQADFDAWTTKPGNPIVVVSQDVPKGFIVYFTQNTPVLLNGKSFILPISSIDLTTIKANPANTTFHLYVILEEGVAKYHLSESVIAETGTTAYNVFWIGTVVTNNLQISSVNVFKRARLDIFGAALEATGSSFPVSYGLPSQTGTIHW